MKKKGYIVMSIVVVLLCVVLCRLWPRTVPPAECSEVYKRYSEVEGIRASYLKDYRVNDTLTVGVTLLEAETDSGWVYLVSKFNIPLELVEMANGNPEIDIWTGQALKGRPEVLCNVAELDEKDARELELEIVTISMQMRAICVFHTRNIEEIDAVFDKKIASDI